MGENMKVHIVEVEWIDSCGNTKIWEFIEGLDHMLPLPATSVGYLIEKTKTYITIAQTLSEQSVARRFTIPLGCVKKIRKLT
jgi:hypothetical protein